MRKIFLTMLMLLSFSLLFVSCKKESISEKVYESEKTTSKSEEVDEKKESSGEMIVKLKNAGTEKELNVDLVTHPVVTIEMADGDEMRIVLLPEVAPNTVNNFIELINKGYYDGLIFHRVIKGFMIQGGCPDGTGMGNPGYSIKAEFADADGLKLPHTEGVISMARSQHPDSAGSQFFIVHKPAPHLDGQYASFGVLVDDESYAVVDKIAGVRTGRADRPKEDVVMKKVTVELNGYEAKEAEKIK